MDVMTPEVLIGWGFGCTSMDCSDETNNGQARSVAYVTPLSRADIYVDTYNDRVADQVIKNVYDLMSIVLVDEADKDMSGARIWALYRGKPVPIAAAWGQDPKRSPANSDLSALDLGTVVVPFSSFQTKKSQR